MPTDQATADPVELQREIERLRTQLAATTEEAERYRKAAYALLRERVPYTSPTEAELKDMLDGPGIDRSANCSTNWNGLS